MNYTTPQLLIAGEWRVGRGTQPMVVHNPATGAEIGRFTGASVDDLAEVARAAAEGFAAWRQRTAHDRASILERGVTRLRQRAEEIATLLTLEQGKPLAESRTEVMVAAEIIKWYAEEGKRVHGRIVPSRVPGATMTVLKQPVGPVLALSPWNYPLILSSRKIGGALAAGCSVVLKGAEETPAAVATMIGCLLDELPAGALQLVFGQPAQISETLIRHEAIRKVTFTGSVEVGRQIARLAADGFKRTTLELGGHAPVIVWSDADLDRAVPMLVAHKFQNAGQACLAPTRFLVHRAGYGRFVDRFAGMARALRLGDGMDPQTQMGPLINARRKAAMAPLVEDAVARGARAIAGEQPGDEGSFYAPTVLANTPPDARVMTEEPFGPLAPVTPFDTLEEALAIANANPYGLAGYLFTDSARVRDICAQRLEVGALAVNNVAVSVPDAPFSGIKNSGIGAESGTEGMESFFFTRTVHSTMQEAAR
jgi:acyl-CoA reductase-like NAD-dependent aldehyde dehydrogenase